ncbi:MULTISPECIES: GNAT family N-acetyltransferase [Micromonospora]|uniref:GNAT family N-acetyltransferase n=1 Tax=Micromonospora solifontis TaxID=2487138 RepID=A0ABX9WB09_9ACTN|nr:MULTISPECIES: GNAT family protein [Micromonospora]NES15290.1 GNAT family N-acetyltransferase [Micromonospora sp. PPF5-17B]NES38776.1 GNAT family N-acetyltransferase [Micromonospora solifontis]NES56294.1 GNAT family N-acetyltransferase [Micromonospora sp. PPF5-6]RNL93558.1 GNAT family N-acetyltransferase [Micromonospora solifontis]
MTPETVEAHGIRLRLFRPDDLVDLVAAAADPLTRRFMTGLPDPYTEESAHWWITEGAPAAWAGGGAAYAVADPATDRLLGTVGLGTPLPERRQLEIGYWMAPWGRGRGVATAATRALAERAFAAGAARLELLTAPENAASQRVALAAGFRHEGVRRAAGTARDGSRYDLVAWVRLADDPPGPTARLLPDLPGGRLTDGVVAVRRLGPADADPLHRLHTLPEVVANRVPPVAPTRESIERRCRLAESHWLAGSSADVAVVDAGTGAVVGGCALVYDEPATGQAMFGYSMLPEARGRGLATRAVGLLAGWAFDVGLARLWAGTRPENVASQRVLEKVGFRREGLLRGRLPGPAGTRIDSVIFGLLAEDRVR